MSKKMWVYSPPRQPKPKVPDNLKKQIAAIAQELIESVLKPRHIQPPPEAARFNYIADIFGKWHRSYFYFCATYACPGPNAITPTFEVRFARLEYVSDNSFNLSYMRHTEQWWEIYTGISLAECLTAVKDEPHFMP